VERIVTGDEEWVFEFIPESKRCSMTWKLPHLTTEKEIFKIEPYIKKRRGGGRKKNNNGDCVLRL
jgi:hypothetical protein